MLTILWQRFRRDARGTVGLLYAIAFIPMLALAGGVIDYVNTINQRARLQAALDAGTLAAMRSGEEDEDVLRDLVESYLRANYRNHPGVDLDLDNLQVSLERNDDGVLVLSASVNAEVHMAFWRVVGINTTPIHLAAEARKGRASLEVVLVLDNTGSMSGSKIAELKTAATQLVQSLADLGTEASTVNVGLVPYTSFVNVGKEHDGEWWLDMDCCRIGGGWWWWWSSWGSSWQGVVGVRDGDLDITDGDYDTDPVPAIDSYVYYGWWLMSVTKPLPVQPLLDVTQSSNLETLTDSIDSMWASGWTYIPAGLAWGWRLLSAEEPFTEGSDEETAREENISKVIVLMTDGANTCRRYGGGYVECGVSSTQADARMRQLCTNIKDAGIYIITVAYDISDPGITELMSDCADMGYYEPDTGELEETFQQIGDSIARMYLSR